MVWPKVTVPPETEGVGGGVGGSTLTCRGTFVACPFSEYAVRTMSVVVRSVSVVEPLAGRSPATPVMTTRAAFCVVHVSVTASGAQPVLGDASNVRTSGAVENAARVAVSGMRAASLVSLWFLIAYGAPV